MRIPLLLSLAIAACLALMPARATSEYNYGKAEYVTIRYGLAPNKQLALAAHGDDESGNGGFHVWLMAEPAHRTFPKAISSTPRQKPFTPFGRRIPAMSASRTATAGTRSRSIFIGSMAGAPI
jgi:hypothetical protein